MEQAWSKQEPTVPLEPCFPKKVSSIENMMRLVEIRGDRLEVPFRGALGKRLHVEARNAA
jgi:hypothetical protein